MNNDLALLQAIEKFNIQPTQNVSMKIQGPTISIAEVCHMCTRGLPLATFVNMIWNVESWLDSLLVPIAK